MSKLEASEQTNRNEKIPTTVIIIATLFVFACVLLFYSIHFMPDRPVPTSLAEIRERSPTAARIGELLGDVIWPSLFVLLPAYRLLNRSRLALIYISLLSSFFFGPVVYRVLHPDAGTLDRIMSMRTSVQLTLLAFALVCLLCVDAWFRHNAWFRWRKRKRA